MAREADYDVDLFAEMARSGTSVLEPNGGSDAVRAPLESFDLDDVTDGRPPS
ncbi:MAG: hypothetical protein JO053_05160 [Acidobacteria bacterium]|nr:hypothetical protein [Acidobacteriota bacterium]